MNLVTIKEEADGDKFAEWLIKNGYVFERFAGLDNIFKVEGDISHPDILDIEKDDTIAKGTFVQEVNMDDTGFGWNLPRICRRRPPWFEGNPRGPLTTFYESLLDGEDTVLYIADTGVDPAVTDITGRRIKQLNWAGVGSDDNGHGTACAVLAAGTEYGVAKKALISSYKVMGADNTGVIGDIVAGIGQARTDYLADNRPGVFSLSLGGIGSSTAVNSAINACMNSGLLFLVSAGNDNTDLGTINSTFISGVNDHMVVGASMYNDSAVYTGSWGTNWGSRVDICAPGFRTTSIRGPEAGGAVDQIRDFSGTSAACPIVAGVALCILGSIGIKLTSRAQANALKNFIKNIATPNVITPYPGMQSLITDKLLYLPPRQRTFSIAGINA